MADAPEVYRLPPSGGIPNSDLPVLVYRRAIAPDSRLASSFERVFASHGWTGSWRNGIYDFHHFHSTAHEVLGLSSGHVDVQLGGEGGPILRLEAGDAVVLPAGTGHRNAGQSDDLEVVGAYDAGRDWDVKKGDPAELEQARRAIAAVPTPQADPLQGETGALPRLWKAVPEAPPGVP